MNYEDKQDRIDAYLLGLASKEERREFEEEISRNEELTAALGDTELAIAAIEFHEDEAMKARLQKLEQKLAGAPAVPEAKKTETVVRSITDRQAKTNARVVDIKSRRAGQLKLLGYAAALLLVLAVGWWSMNLGSGFDAQQLAMDSFRPYDNITTTNVRGENEDAAEAAAFSDYDAGNFAAAEQKLAALEATDVNQFYLGQSLLAQDKFDQASGIFSKLTTAPDFPLVEEADYYLGLTQLGTNNVDSAKQILSKIADNPTHTMQKEAEALLAKM